MTQPALTISDDQIELLDAWLMKRCRGIVDVVTLEGFLTAILIGPNVVAPTVWLSKVWGSRQPQCRDLDELRQFTALLVLFHNDLALTLDEELDDFQPTFYERVVDGRRIEIVDEWCCGFLKGVRLSASAWKPLKQRRAELLKPFNMFATRAGWAELESGDVEKLHRKWSKRIAPAIREIHAFWLPHRHAEMRSDTPETWH